MSTEKHFESKDFTDEELVTASTETMGGSPSQKSLWAQSELSRRLMESIRTLQKSTEYYSKVIGILTLFLFAMGYWQLALTIFPVSEKSFWIQLVVFLIITFFFVWLFRQVEKEKWLK